MSIKLDRRQTRALRIAKHDGRYLTYSPVLVPDGEPRPLRTYVICAATMAGPWGEPIDMRIDGMIDPGPAVGEDGRRCLSFKGGRHVYLTFFSPLGEIT